MHSVFNTNPPSFTIDEVDDVLHHHLELQSISDLKELYSDRDQNFLFSNNSKKYILKIFNHAEDISVIKLQLDAVNYISKKSVNILLPNIKESIVEIRKSGKIFRAIVYEYIEGYFFYEKISDEEQYQKLGKFIGKISSALVGFQNSGSKRIFEWDVQNIDLIYQRIKYINSRKDKNIVKHFLDEYENNVIPNKHKLRMSIIHNDCNDHNIIVNEQKNLLGIIDFGDMVYSFQVLEPAVCMAYLALNKKNIRDVLFTFLKGYQSYFSLQKIEIKCIIYMVCIRLCITVTMAAWRKSIFPNNTYLTISESSAWATLKYFKNENLNEWTNHLLKIHDQKKHLTKA